MKSTKLILLILSGLIFIGCGTTKFTNSYKRIKERTLKITNPKKVVKLDFTSRKYKLTSEKKKKRSLYELSELGQFILIKEYSKKNAKSKDFRANLVEPLEKLATKPLKIVEDGALYFPTKFTFFIDDILGKHDKEGSANRITSLKIKVKLKSDEVEFIKFNGFQTKYEYYDIGAIENTSSRNFSLEATIGAGKTSTSGKFDENGNQIREDIANFGPNVTGLFGGSDSLKENILLRRRVISQAGNLSADEMTIYLEGTPQRNLNGPITVELTLGSNLMKTNLTEVEYVNFIKIPKVKINPKVFLKPDIKYDIKGDVSMEWSYRRVIKNGKTSYEGDDIIEYYTCDEVTYENDVAIIKKDNLKKITYDIELTGGVRLFLKKNLGREYALRFLSQDEAIDFINHIFDKNVNTVGGFKIVKSGGTAISVAEISKLEINSQTF